MHFAKSDHVERYLKGVGADFRYRDSVQFSKLDPGWADKNPCRPGRAIIDVAMSYAERMESGSLAPPAIIVKKPAGFNLLDGRQRCFASHALGASVFCAYELIEPSPRLEQLVAMGANAALNGVRPPLDFLIASAIHFMEEFEATAKEASVMAGVTVATIEQHLATRRVRSVLIGCGIDPQLANGSLAALEPLIGEPNVMSKAYLSIEKAEATVPMANSLVADMMKNPGKGRLLALDRWLERPEIQARIAGRTGRKMRAMAAAFQSARALRTILKQRFVEIDSEMKPNDRREWAKLAENIASKMRKLAGEFVAVPN